ncbi:response regulator transcription factor [Pannus brasiliensis CCIBt3594]|uniref:Response regulator transcription factor n=1 Tax=Pannus brasiliensis CCIBt3594 TaxID=1427578 RepID=A0AAW9QV77_9CHRO
MPLLILIADDDPGIRLAIKDYLELAGYSVVAASNGEEALSRLDTYHPHLLVSDIKMPRMDGYTLVSRVRQRPEFRLLPVIFLTERGTTEERIRGYQVGCDVYLPKPFEMEELKAVIRNLLERSQIIQSEWQYKKDPVQIPGRSAGVSTPVLEEITLTNRERDVLEHLARGLSNVDIGHQLHLSPRTVEKYVSSLFRKTLTGNRAELVRYSIEHGLIE